MRQVRIAFAREYMSAENGVYGVGARPDENGDYYFRVTVDPERLHDHGLPDSWHGYPVKVVPGHMGKLAIGYSRGHESPDDALARELAPFAEEMKAKRAQMRKALTELSLPARDNYEQFVTDVDRLIQHLAEHPSNWTGGDYAQVIDGIEGYLGR